MSADVVVESEFAPHPGIGINDYGHALIHLAWYRADRARSLMFGVVELYPSEFPAPIGTAEKDFELRSFGNKNRLYVKRVCVPAKTAVEWYERCIHGVIEIPNDLDGRGSPKLLSASGFAQEPQWPRLITASDRIPFVPQCWQAPKVHHLLQPDLGEDAAAVALCPKARTWLSEQMFVDFESNSELLGSLHLIAPDPVLRGIDHRLSTENKGQEASVMRFHTRAKQSIDGLRVILLDHRPTGLGDLVEKQITSTRMEIPHPPGTTDQIEAVVLNRAGSIVSWSRPTGFMQAVSVGIMTAGGPQQRVVVPATNDQPESTYVRVLRGHESFVTVGEPRSPKDSICLLSAGQARREMAQLDDRYPERWFHGDRETATAFIRTLISSAKHRLWIVDPYFTTVELISYALATSSIKLPVLIVTSAEAMTKKDRLDPTLKAAEVLQVQLPNLMKHGNFAIHVLTGSPAVHDRFLVVDDSVWFSGNSLHTIGDRAGMVVKLRNSAEIISNLNDILASDRATPWQEWMANRTFTVASNPTNRHTVVSAIAMAAAVAAVGFWKIMRNVERRRNQ